MDINIASLAPLPVDNLYHVAFLVRDVEESMAHLGKVFSAEWARPIVSKMEGRDSAPWTVTTVYSMQGPPFLELLSGFDDPGCPAALGFDSTNPGVHHFGVYAARWRDELARLEELGMTVEATGAGYGFVRSPLGFRIEVVSWKGRGFLINYMEQNGRSLGAP
jgi:hypothetical protein